MLYEETLFAPKSFSTFQHYPVLNGNTLISVPAFVKKAVPFDEDLQYSGNFVPLWQLNVRAEVGVYIPKRIGRRQLHYEGQCRGNIISK